MFNESTFSARNDDMVTHPSIAVLWRKAKELEEEVHDLCKEIDTIEATLPDEIVSTYAEFRGLRDRERCGNQKFYTEEEIHDATRSLGVIIRHLVRENSIPMAYFEGVQRELREDLAAAKARQAAEYERLGINKLLDEVRWLEDEARELEHRIWEMTATTPADALAQLELMFEGDELPDEEVRAAILNMLPPLIAIEHPQR